MSASSDDGEDYEVEAIRASRRCKHKSDPYRYDYLIKWKGYESDENTWQCCTTIDAPVLLQQFWDKQRQGTSKTKYDSKKRDVPSTSHTPETRPTKKKTKTKQPQVVSAYPYSSDEDQSPDNLGNGSGTNLQHTSSVMTTIAPQASLSSTSVPSSSWNEVLSSTPAMASYFGSVGIFPQSSAETNKDTIPNTSEGHNIHSNSLNHGMDRAPANADNDTAVKPSITDTLAILQPNIDNDMNHKERKNRDKGISDATLSFRVGEKDGNPTIIFNGRELKVCTQFRSDWNWEEQVSHIEKLMIKKRRDTFTFYFVVRWKDGELSAHDSHTIRSRCPLKALDFHEKQIANEL